SVGYVGGSNGVYKTTNGGQTWQLLSYFVATGNQAQDYYTLNFNTINLHFFNEMVGIAYGWHSYNHEIIMRTVDGGASWTLTHFEYPETQEYEFNELNSIYAWDNLNLIIVGNSGRVLRSSDGGQTWTDRILIAGEIDLSKVQFTNATQGYATGIDKGQFYVSTDGGASWNLRLFDFTITDFHFFDEENGVAIGNKNFYKTTNGGVTWTKCTLEVGSRLHLLKFVDNLNGYATTVNGYIYKTTDGGRTWLKIYQNGSTLTSISLVSPDLIWFSSSTSNVLHSSNGGWPTMTQPVLSGISTTSAPGGSYVIISGSRLDFVTDVKFNGISASFINGYYNIETYVPRGASTGKIELVWAQGTVISSFDFLVPLTPKLYDPGFVKRGAVTVLQGENLQHVTQLNLGTTSVPFTILNNQEISFNIPANYTGLASVLVLSAYGEAYTSLGFLGSPTISSVTPNASSPGKFITINGTNLFMTTEVWFGVIKANTFTINNNTSISVAVPTVSETTEGTLRVVTPEGAAHHNVIFKIYATPEITSITPTVLKVGEEIKIEGNNLPDKPFGKIFINGIEVPETEIRLVDKHTLFVKMPQVNSGSIPIRLVNPGGVSKTQNVDFTITGVLSNRIESVYPIRVNNNNAQPITITGVFPAVDSLTVNGKRHVPITSRSNYIMFMPTLATTSGVVTLYKNGEAFSYVEELIITENSSPVFDFEPKIASVGTRITVNTRRVRFIKSVLVNGEPVPFSPKENAESISLGFSFMLTNEVTSGYVTVETLDGTFQHPEILQVVPETEVRPIIYSHERITNSNVYVAKLFGNNFSNVTRLRFDNITAGFEILDDDTLLVKRPENASAMSYSTINLILDSPVGHTSYQFQQTTYATQKIVS
ncbi:MAG: IPT/TIG domain-containing protein, partial [Cyclobacteriaceae bacterium]|nr:IPT/TIG domain-containing protein [Cyclobacteriaceae bacterium]